MWESRQGIRDMYTPAPEAARRIVDAILDDDGPLRYGCDDMSEGMLKGWRSVASDDDWLRPMLRVRRRRLRSVTCNGCSRPRAFASPTSTPRSRGTATCSA